jgi:hypothetical protein
LRERWAAFWRFAAFLARSSRKAVIVGATDETQWRAFKAKLPTSEEAFFRIEVAETEKRFDASSLSITSEDLVVVVTIFFYRAQITLWAYA